MSLIKSLFMGSIVGARWRGVSQFILGGLNWGFVEGQGNLHIPRMVPPYGGSRAELAEEA